MTQDHTQGQGQSTQDSNLANLRYGVYHQNGTFVGKTVSEVRTALSSAWGIPNDAAAYKGKVKMEDNYVIQPGDMLEFHRRQGEKG